ncbi:hypothetical protein HYW53_03180 [Candidatus Giovannonibacteria bacterium]|nr:hypothetical protein [Candidatus Giovannonibacteria bacterium]
MADQNAVKFIKDAREAGLKDDVIQHQLEGAGWKLGDVANAFSEANKVQQKPASVFQPEEVKKFPQVEPKSFQTFAPALPANEPKVNNQSSIVTKESPKEYSKLESGQPAQSTFLSNANGTAPAIQNIPQNSFFKGDSKFASGIGAIKMGGFKAHRVFILTLVVLILGGTGVFAGWAYYKEMPNRVFTAMPSKMSDLKSLTYSLRIKLKTQNIDESVSQNYEERKKLEDGLEKLAPASVFQSVLNFFEPGKIPLPPVISETAAPPSGVPQVLPQDLSDSEIEIRASGAFESVDEDNGNVSILFDMNVKQKDQSIGFGAEFRDVNEVYYFRLVELPIQLMSPMLSMTPFSTLDPSQLLKNWYSLKAKTLSDLKLLPKDDTEVDREKMEKIRNVLKESTLFEVASVGKDGDNFHYTLIANIADIKHFFGEIMKIEQERPLTKSDEQAINQFVDKLSKASIEAWVNKNTNYLERFNASIPLADYGGIGVRTEITLELSDFDTAEVKKPSNAISFDEELKQMIASFVTQGMSPIGGGVETARMRGRDAKRVADIQNLTKAMEISADAQGRYPKTLAELTTQIPGINTTDTLDNKAYKFAVSADRKSYHVGASLEEKISTQLSNDSDSNLGFNGADSKGCGGEANRYCYDLKSF